MSYCLNHERFIGGVAKNRRSFRMVLLTRLLGVPETEVTQIVRIDWYFETLSHIEAYRNMSELVFLIRLCPTSLHL